MKAIAFTIDAVFAIMIAMIGISILLYFHYSPVTPYVIKYSSLSVLMKALSSTALSNFTATPLAAQVNSQYQGVQQVWPEFLQNNANNASNEAGPYTGSLSFVFNSSTNINEQALLAGYGNVYLVSGSEIFAISPYTGHIVWRLKTPTTITSDLLYKGMFIYANNTDLVAINAQNSQMIWDNAGIVSTYGIPTYPLKAFNNMILLPTSNSGAMGTGVVGVFSSNGTQAWIAEPGGGVNSIATATGSIAMEVANAVSVFTYQDQATPIDAGNLIYPYAIPTGIIVPFGSILTANAAAITGLSAYNGSVFYQSTSNYTYALGAVQSGFWSMYMPPRVGSALPEAQPVSSKDNVYTLWSNRYIVDQNENNGLIRWIARIPYSGTLSPYMMLAYGRLYVVVGSKLLAFGTCQGNSNQSILSNIVSMYLSGQYSCGNVLLNTANPNQNSSISVGSNLYPNVIHFSSAHSYVDLGNSSALSPEAGASGRMSLCTWYRINSLTGYYGPLIKGENPPSSGNAWEYTLDQQGGGAGTKPSFTVWSGAGANIAHGYANSITFGSMVGNWSFACFTYDYPDQKAYYYFDGVQYNGSITNTVGPASIGTGDLIIGGGENSSNPTGNTAYSNVDVADLQIYNIILNPSQIYSLYQQGIGAFPAQNTGLDGWWLFGGDTNDYSGNGYTGFPFNISYVSSGFISPGYNNAYEVDVSKLAVTATNYSTGKQAIYTAGVYSWK